MEEAQKKSQRAGLPTTNNWLAAFATSSLLLANSSPNDLPEWERNPKADQTWGSWKENFNPIHKNLE